MTPWNVSGLLFENCNCQVVCPGHVHFNQTCTHQRCLGYWAIRVDAGAYGEMDLAGTRAIIAYDAPPLMIEGGWRERLIIDVTATEAQRNALEAILTGRAGGPWEKLARFVGEFLETRYAPIDIEDERMSKQVVVEGLLDSSVTTLRGRDREAPVRIENMFNQIHATEQIVARGESRYDDGDISFLNEGSHGLWSRFDWRVDA